MKSFLDLRRFAALLCCGPLLMDCSPRTMPSRVHNKLHIQCFSNIPNRDSLPPGAHVDCHGQPTDAFGRSLSYDEFHSAWRAIDDGVGIDPLRPAATRDEIQSAQHDASLYHLGVRHGRILEADDCIDTDVGRSVPSSAMNCMDDNGNGELISIKGTPRGRLLLAPDAYYYDENGDEWWYDPRYGRWYRTVVLLHTRCRGAGCSNCGSPSF